MRILFCLLLSWIASASVMAGDADELAQINALVDESRFLEATSMLEPYAWQHPQDLSATYLLARLYSWQSRWDESLTLYTALLAQYPGNVDYQLGKGQVLFWRGDFEEAYATLDSARDAAPGYEQIWRNELQVLDSLRGEPNYAAKWSQLKQDAAARFPSSDWSSIAAVPVLEMQPRHWRRTYESLAGYETLGAGREPWRRAQIGVAFASDTRKAVNLEARSEQRFALTDWQFGANYSQSLPRVTVGAEFAFSPGAQVLPEMVAAINAQARLFDSWTPSLGYRYSAYSNSGVHTVSGGAETYLKDVLYSYQAAAVFNSGYSAGSNHRAQAIYFYGVESRVGLLFLTGTEIERLGPKATLESQITAAVVSIEHWVSNRFALISQANGQKQGSLYTRYGLEFGVRYRP